MRTRPVFRLLVSMSVPMMLSMLIQSLYNIVDSIYVSWLGTDALTAVSLAYPLQNAIISAGVGIGVGISSAISIHLGSGNQEKADRAATMGIVLTVFHCLLFILAGLFITRPFLSLFTKDPAILEDACSYTRIVLCLSFGALLQIGELTGTVYADSDRDSTKDAEEQGVPNVRVTVTDASGRVYEDTTDENGQYTISGLPSNQKLTVTVYNPYDHESRAGSYRFSAYSASTGGAIGSDVTSADSGQTGTVTLEGLTDGTGVVNAGLITPYKVTFNGIGNSTVNPAEIYRFPGEAVGLNGQRVTVQTGVGETFLDKWNMSVNSGTATTVEDSALLTTEIKGDTVFTPVIESEKNAVYFMVWDNDAGKLVPLSIENITYGSTLGSVTGSEFPDMTEYQRPGYALTGWDVNGMGIKIIANDATGQSEILNARVTGMISYHAVYTPLGNITVTLNPNYEGAKSTVMTGQTYGQPISYTAPTREGYTFLGWATTSDADEGSMSLTCPATDTTFYAVWEPGTVRLTLMENGGTWTDGSDFENGYIDGTVGAGRSPVWAMISWAGMSRAILIRKS